LLGLPSLAKNSLDLQPRSQPEEGTRKESEPTTANHPVDLAAFYLTLFYYREKKISFLNFSKFSLKKARARSALRAAWNGRSDIIAPPQTQVSTLASLPASPTSFDSIISVYDGGFATQYMACEKRVGVGSSLPFLPFLLRALPGLSFPSTEYIS
jgi:hypothetical protein